MPGGLGEGTRGLGAPRRGPRGAAERAVRSGVAERDGWGRGTADGRKGTGAIGNQGCLGHEGAPGRRRRRRRRPRGTESGGNTGNRTEREKEGRVDTNKDQKDRKGEGNVKREMKG